MIKLKCLRCNKEWEYNGETIPNRKYSQYTSCPRCKTSVKIECKEETRNEMVENQLNKVKSGGTKS